MAEFPPPAEVILTLSCADRPGIVRAVSDFLFQRGCDIVTSQQYGDPASRVFFMRVHARTSSATHDLAALRSGFAGLAEEFGMVWGLYDPAVKPRVVLMVSALGHTLNDLLYRWRIGALPIDIAAIVSNHTALRPMAEWHGVPFAHIPITPETKSAAEARLLDIITEGDVELVVLARYMQVLSTDLCQRLQGRAINIHHSFLPGFKGAKPYHQAHERGVKLIGATAHYVTADLDEGPIIEQGVARVDHAATPDDLAAVGREVECQVLARAVLWHVERRVLLNGVRTVVFS